jgi:hypothetical protein
LSGTPYQGAYSGLGLSPAARAAAGNSSKCEGVVLPVMQACKLGVIAVPGHILGVGLVARVQKHGKGCSSGQQRDELLSAVLLLVIQRC